MKIMAVSAPQWVSRKNVEMNNYSFDSQTPFSLQNALRDAVDKSIDKNNLKESIAWRESNFRASRSRNESIILMNYWNEEKEAFKNLFQKINPDILFIGAMSLCFKGAIEIAKYAKSRKKEKIFIVIGGKHINETFFKSRNNSYLNHIASPLELIQKKTIPNIFDLVVSGDGEKIITRIGEIIHNLLKKKSSFVNFNLKKKSIIRKLEKANGDWIVGQVIDKEIYYLESKNKFINYENLAYPIEQFNFSKGFRIFNTDYTAHAYSDTSRGCSYNCFFCSEKSTVSGQLRYKSETPIYRLYQHFKKLDRINKTNYRGKTFSIFIEDSIMLSGKPRYIEKFISIISQEITDNSIKKRKFGAQFTLDIFITLANENLISQLAEIGLDYVAFGIETIDDEIAKSFSKNTDKKEGWLRKTEKVVEICSLENIKCGMFLIWGLGETQFDRRKQLLQIREWIEKYKVPIDIGLNIATQHPLRIVNDTNLDQFGYKKYDYLEWGTDENDEYLPYFVELFGEASTRYAINKDKLPSIIELNELRNIYYEIKEKTYNMVSDEK